MEQRHMQEKSRGAARPDVDARARAIQEQIIHIPRPAQPGNARPAGHTQRPAGRLRADATMPQSRANAGARQAAVCSLPVWPLLS